MAHLELVPTNVSDAQEFVRQVHRTHGPTQNGFGAMFAVAVARSSTIVGVAIVGRPVARKLADEWTAEVSRVAVIEGEKNACSKLYGACWRAARALGYRRLVTYTLASEPGTSLVAAGWTVVAEVNGASWHRVDRHPTQDKLRWEVSS